MNIVRTILAVLVTISLAFAPGASAFTSHHQNDPHAAMMSADAATDMTDCMKAMGGDAGHVDKSDCKCCDAKSTCPDSANCTSKCCKVIAALKPAGKIVPLVQIAYRQMEPAKPPNWLSSPPFTPPRS